MKNSYFSKKFEAKLRKQLTESFQTLDQDLKGYIQLSTLKKQFSMFSHSPTQSQLQHLFQLFNSKDKNRIYLNDYINIMIKQLNLKQHDVGDVYYKLTDDKDVMTLRDVERLANELGENGNWSCNKGQQDVSRRIFGELDKNNNRSVTQDEFKKFITKVSNK